ncbi:MAG: glycosyltransferase [Thermoguttaceae bacterium]|nr:glycosyltransferase [Thermoguttaceae bacterium]
MSRRTRPSRENKPSVSLIITCYNKPEILKISLQTAMKQTVPPLEIIVADDGSREETFEVTRELRKQTNIPIVHVWQEDKGFRLNRSRNNGLAVATGDYVILADGDCFFGPRFVEDHLSVARPGRFVAGTRGHVQSKRRDYILRTGDARVTIFTPHTSKRLHSIRSRMISALVSKEGTPGEQLIEQNDPGVIGANLAFWREDACKINGFDERYEGYGGDDKEFVYRLSRLGVNWYKLKNLGVAFHFIHSKTKCDHELMLQRIKNSLAQEGYRLPDEFGLTRALREGPERIER